MKKFTKKQKTYIDELLKKNAELTEFIENCIYERVTDIRNCAHSQSTGPADPDGYWEIREKCDAIHQEINSAFKKKPQISNCPDCGQKVAIFYKGPICPYCGWHNLIPSPM